MNISQKNSDKKSSDPFDKLIFEKGLRIKNLVIDKELDLMIVVLNNSKVLRLNISDFPKLKKAGKNQLNDWKLENKGVAVSWESLNEDLSVKGFIKSAALNAALHTLEGNSESAFA
ncbi:MAG: DUF2442 domain-containing protein [Bacteroidia bacterium]